MATSGAVPAARFFWPKTRAGRREVNRPEGGPIQMPRIEDTRPSIERLILWAQERLKRSDRGTFVYNNLRALMRFSRRIVGCPTSRQSAARRSGNHQRIASFI
jgi:hypothetical protein